MGSYGLPLGTLLLSFRVLPVPLMSLFRWWMSVFLLTKRSSYWPLPLPSALGSSTPCRFVSLIPRVGVRHPSVSFRASWRKRRMPPLTIRSLRGSVYRPYLSQALILTLDSYVRCYLARTAKHCPRCERLFVTAGRLKKEISKNTVTFWLRKVISQAYLLSGRPLPGPSPKARETCGIAPSLLFKKNFAVHQVLKAGTWRRHTTFTRHYLRDLSHKSLDTFHLGPVVAAQAMV